MKETVMMKCGHIANATDIYNNPVCVICQCHDIAKAKQSLQGRKAKCAQCGKIKDSNYKLPFFEYKENSKYDEFYCGCSGWN